MTKPSFKAMFKRIKFSNVAANVLAGIEVIDTMAKLAKITAVGASKLAKAICSPRRTGVGTHVTEGAEHNLLIAVAVVNNILRVACTIKCDEILAPDSSQVECHEQQRLMEE